MGNFLSGFYHTSRGETRAVTHIWFSLVYLELEVETKTMSSGCKSCLFVVSDPESWSFIVTCEVAIAYVHVSIFGRMGYYWLFLGSTTSWMALRQKEHSRSLLSMRTLYYFQVHASIHVATPVWRAGQSKWVWSCWVIRYRLDACHQKRASLILNSTWSNHLPLCINPSLL